MRNLTILTTMKVTKRRERLTTVSSEPDANATARLAVEIPLPLPLGAKYGAVAGKAVAAQVAAQALNVARAEGAHRVAAVVFFVRDRAAVVAREVAVSGTAGRRWGFKMAMPMAMAGCRGVMAGMAASVRFGGGAEALAAGEYVFDALVGGELARLAGPAGGQGAAVHVLELEHVA
jgi:hypothetical protein